MMSFHSIIGNDRWLPHPDLSNDNRHSLAFPDYGKYSFKPIKSWKNKTTFSHQSFNFTYDNILSSIISISWWSNCLPPVSQNWDMLTYQPMIGDTVQILTSQALSRFHIHFYEILELKKRISAIDLRLNYLL